MSQPVAFEPGVHYVLQREGYQVVQVLHDGTLVARHLATNTYISHRLDQLLQHWQENTLEFARSGPNLREITGTTLKTTYTFADLADLPDHLQEITWHRYQLIRPLVYLSSRQRTKQVVEERIRTYLSFLEKEKTQGEPTFPFGRAIARRKTEPSSSSPRDQTEQAHTDDLPPTTPNDEREPLLPDNDPSFLRETEASEHTPSSIDKATATPLQPLLDLTPRTVSRWIRRYQISHQDIRSLVPSYHQRGPHQSQMSPFVETLLQQAIKQTYLTNVRAPVSHVITSFQKLIIIENEKHSPEERLPTPGNMTVYRYLQRLDSLEVDRARLGPARAERDHHQSGLGPRPTRPNQRAEFDFAQLDLLVVDPVDRLPIGRPTLAAIRDKYTGYPLGIFISFDPPSYRLVMECLLYAILPKNHVQLLFQTQHAYLAFGVPEVLVVDNAIELDRDLELACLQLGIELQDMPVRKPWFKGSVERWFRTLNTDLIHVIPGTTFSHFLERGEYDSQKHACMTIDRLWELLHLWIVDVYTQEVHEGVGGHPQGKGVPALIYQRALDEQFVPRLPPSRNDLLVLLTRTTKRKVHHYGIEFENLIYQSTALAPLRSKLARAKKHRTTHSEIAQDKEDDIKAGIVQIKYHPGDLSRIWVLDPFVSEYIEVLAVDQHYTKDLSLWKHHVISRYVREELKRQVDTEALVLARARLQQLIADEMRLTRTIRSRQTMARWWNEQVTTWINEQAVDPSEARLSAKEPTASPSPTSPEREQVPPSLSPSERAFDQERTGRSQTSVADLSAPLPPSQEQVVLIKEQVSVGNSTPFSAFPPLSSEEHSPKAAIETHGGTPPTPQTTEEHSVTSANPRTTKPSRRKSENKQHVQAEVALPTDPGTTVTERKNRFGIEVRSTRWY